jgi:TetR/AcrR family transcriptional regulator
MMRSITGNKNTVHNRMSAADRQHQLLEVAMSVFSRRGFKGATTKEIAAVAGVNEAVIFQHFPSKEALYSAILEIHLNTGDEEKRAEEAICMERNDDQGVFRSFILRILESYRCDPMLQRVILFAALEGHEQGLSRMQKQFAPVFEQFMEYISRRQREGAFVNCNPHAIMIGLGGVAHQYGLLTQIFRVPDIGIADEPMAQLFARILLNGIRKTKSVKIPKQKPADKSKRKVKK